MFYLDLSERNKDGTLVAKARGTIWADTAKRILPGFERATGATLAPGVKSLVRAKPVFKPQYGLSVDIDAIDPDYTLGFEPTECSTTRGNFRGRGQSA